VDGADPTPLPPCEQHEAAEALIAASGADFRIGGARAFYDVGGDYVQVPPQPAFAHQIDFYRTALHELGHWTGNKARLARDQPGRFGSALYAREELCAELASAYLCAALGIVPTVRHADYLVSWLNVLRADNRAIFKAASQASKAADFLLAFVRESECTLARAA
jgi:antirestriction protein ArdC